MAIAYGDVVTCTFQTGDTDVFTFAGAAGDVIVVNLYDACASFAAQAAPRSMRAAICLEEIGSMRYSARPGPLR